MEPSEAKRLLQGERTRIEAALDASSRQSRANSDDDQAEATQTYEASLDAGMRTQLEEELKAVERAERRLAEGTYGLSIESGEPIPDARLSAQPTAERTVEEQQRYAG